MRGFGENESMATLSNGGKTLVMATVDRTHDRKYGVRVVDACVADHSCTSASMERL
jgi:hypothetical protein